MGVFRVQTSWKFIKLTPFSHKAHKVFVNTNKATQGPENISLAFRESDSEKTRMKIINRDAQPWLPQLLHPCSPKVQSSTRHQNLGHDSPVLQVDWHLSPCCTAEQNIGGSRPSFRALQDPEELWRRSGLMSLSTRNSFRTNFHPFVFSNLLGH